MHRLQQPVSQRNPQRGVTVLIEDPLQGQSQPEGRLLEIVQVVKMHTISQRILGWKKDECILQSKLIAVMVVMIVILSEQGEGET